MPFLTDLIAKPTYELGGKKSCKGGSAACVTGAQAMLFSYSVVCCPGSEAAAPCKKATTWEEAWLNEVGGAKNLMGPREGKGFKHIVVKYYAQRTLADEIDRLVVLEGPLMGGSIGLVLLYMSISLGRFNRVHSRIMLGAAAAPSSAACLPFFVVI